MEATAGPFEVLELLEVDDCWEVEDVDDVAEAAPVEVAAATLAGPRKARPPVSPAMAPALARSATIRARAAGWRRRGHPPDDEETRARVTAATSRVADRCSPCVFMGGSLSRRPPNSLAVRRESAVNDRPDDSAAGGDANALGAARTAEGRPDEPERLARELFPVAATPRRDGHPLLHQPPVVPRVEAGPGAGLHELIDSFPGEFDDQFATAERGEDLSPHPEPGIGPEPGSLGHRRIGQEPGRKLLEQLLGTKGSQRRAMA